MRRRILALLLVLILCLGALPVASAAENPITVYVTISNKGDLQLIRYPITVSDVNNNGFCDIDDALWLAHNNDYTKMYGAYSSMFTDSTSGRWITKLWGGGAHDWYAYRCNGKEPDRADTEVFNGDEIYAWICVTTSDLAAVEDKYSAFTQYTASITAGESLDLQMKPKSAVNLGVDIKVYSMSSDSYKKRTEIPTDAVMQSDGTVSVHFPKSGTYLVTAKERSGATNSLVPPYCIVTVAPTASYTVSSVYGQPGDTVELTVSLEHAIGQNVTSFCFTPEAAPGLTLTDATYTNELPIEWDVELENGVVTVFMDTDTYAPMEPPAGDVVKLTYEVSETAAAVSYPVSLTDFQFFDEAEDEIEVPCTVESGGVVASALCGDLNGDAAVNNQDMILLRQYLVGLKTEEDIAVSAADVNADNVIDLTDVIILARHLTKWPEYGTLPYNP